MAAGLASQSLLSFRVEAGPAQRSPCEGRRKRAGESGELERPNGCPLGYDTYENHAVLQDNMLTDLDSGAVRGEQLYGRYPALAMNGGEDYWIPSTSLDQYGATLAQVSGVTPDGLSRIFPNLANFTPSQWTLGFTL